MEEEQFDLYWTKFRDKMQPEDWSNLWDKLGEREDRPDPQFWDIEQSPPAQSFLRRIIVRFWKRGKR